MRRYDVFFLLPLLFILSPLIAFSGTFHLSADLLYMQSSLDQTEFVIDSIQTVSNPSGERLTNEQRYHFGYKVEGSYYFCNSLTEVALKWTHFPNFSEDKTVSGEHLYSILNVTNPQLNDEDGTGTICDNFSIRFLDAFLRQKIVDGRCFSLSLLGGVQYGYLKLHEAATFPFLLNLRSIDATSRTHGLGPEIGVESRYRFLGCWQFVSDLMSGWLIADIDKDFSDNEGPSTIYANVKNDKYWRLIPTFDLRLGLNYARSLLCRQFDLELGYEIIVAWKAIESIYFVDNGNHGSSFNKERTLSMQGPYAHLGISF